MALGFFLGMRHATDPDHVIAVTNIVSRQKAVKQGALIGAIASLCFGIFVVYEMGFLGGLFTSHPNWMAH